MDAALRIGRRHIGNTGPNPSVGCVIVKDGRLIAQAVTALGGRPHAETQALAQAGTAAKGATAYVTLEPCSHHGKTPPCANALIDTGVARVVIALQDPDPRVDGGGTVALRAAGIEVQTGVLTDQARQDHAGFLSKVTQGRPFVTLKLAQSADGRIATASGESKWITGADARRATHLLRARNDAIMVGAGTVRADDPALTVRIPGLEARSPIRIIVSGKADWPETKMLFDGGPEVWAIGPHAPQKTSMMHLSVAADHGEVDLKDALEKLTDHGITRLFCEGGARLAASLIKAKLVDQLALFTAPKIIGGTGLPSIEDLGIGALSEAPMMKETESRPIGADRLTLYTLR